MLRVDVGTYLLEVANPGHEHQRILWETPRLPDEKMLIGWLQRG